MSASGYLVPENPAPDGFRCFKVYVPDDDFYQYAFFGAYEFFGTWLAWERDSDRRGSVAAAAWRDAIALTRCCMDCENVDYSDAFLSIADAIRSVSVVQTVNVSGSCSGGGNEIVCGPDGTPTVNPPPDYNPNDEYVDQLPDDWSEPLDENEDMPTEISDAIGSDDWADWDDWACGVSDMYATMLGRSVIVLIEGVDRLTTVAQVITFLSWAGLAKVVTKGGFALMVKALRNIAAYEQLDQLAEELQEVAESLKSGDLHDVVKCALYRNRHSLVTAKIEMLQDLHDWMIDRLYDGQLADAIRDTLDWLTPLELLVDMYFLADAMEPIPINSDCTGCGAADDGAALFEFDTGDEGFENTPYQYDNWGEWDGNGYLVTGYGQWGQIFSWYNTATFAQKIGLTNGESVYIERVEFKLSYTSGLDRGDEGMMFVFDPDGVFSAGRGAWLVPESSMGEFPLTADVSIGINSTVALTANQRLMEIVGTSEVNGQAVRVDELRVYYSEV